MFKETDFILHRENEKSIRRLYKTFYANWMDQQGIKWEYEPSFKLSTGKSYAPDFKVNGHVIIEVKGYWSEVGLAKWKQFCVDYPEFTKFSIMWDDLIELGF